MVKHSKPGEGNPAQGKGKHRTLGPFIPPGKTSVVAILLRLLRERKGS